MSARCSMREMELCGTSFMHPLLEFGLGGQFAKQEQVGDFQEGAALSEHFDGISTVPEDSPVAINVSNAAAARCRVHEGRIVGHQSKIFRIRLDLPQAHRTDCAVLDGDGIRLTSAIVCDSECVL